MEEKQLATIGAFCLNEACEEYQKVNQGNMLNYGKPETGVPRERCKTCQQTFSQTKGTRFSRCRHCQEEIVEGMQMLGDRNTLAAIHRIKGVKEETVCTWLERAASQVEQFEEGIIRKPKLSRVQTDALWTYVGHKGEKGGSQSQRQEDHFGAEPPLTWTRVGGWDVP